MSPKKKTSKKSGAKKASGKSKTARKVAKKATTKKKAAAKKKTTTKKTVSSSAKTSKKTVKKAVKSAKKASTAAKGASSQKGAVAVSTEAVKRVVKKSRRSKRELRVIRESLVKKKDDLARSLRSELSELEAPDKHHLADLEEMASDTHDTDSLCEIMEVGANTLEQVDRALRKVDDGTYGICEACEADIPMARLEALPFASLCIPCKEKEELGLLPPLSRVED